MIRKCITISEEDQKTIDKNCIRLSTFVQKKLKEVREDDKNA